MGIEMCERNAQTARPINLRTQLAFNFRRFRLARDLGLKQRKISLSIEQAGDFVS